MCLNCPVFFIIRLDVLWVSPFQVVDLSGAMFICYCITLASYSDMKAYCSNSYYSNRYDGSYTYHDCYQQYGFHRDTAVNVAGLGSCLLLISLGEFFLALASSIYCCTVVCCGTSPAVVSTVSNYHLHHSVVNVKS